MPLIICFTAQYFLWLKHQLSWGKLRCEPATRWFDESFAPIPKSYERFARQHRYRPPPGFPRASPCSGIVHHLSGPNRHTLTQPTGGRSVLGKYIVIHIVCTPQMQMLHLPFSTREVLIIKVWYLLPCASVWLLGPCYKTGGGTPFPSPTLR